MDKLLYLQKVKAGRDHVPPERRDNFDLYFAARQKDPPVALTLSIAFGTLGIDRFYIGNVILGILKLITFGGFIIWTIVDWFLIMGSTRKANAAIAEEVKILLG